MRNRKIIWLTVTIMFMVVSTGYAQISKEEALTNFVSAGISYKDGAYNDAIDKYNAIISGGRESGAVYYNLGNSYYRIGDIGRAILNYERARRLIPRDSDLNFNNRYVAARADQYGAGEVQNFIMREVNDFIGYYTVNEMVLMVVIAFFVLGVFILAALYLDWSRQVVRNVSIVLSVIIITYVSGLGFKMSMERERAVILTPGESFFEPRNDSTVHFKLSEGGIVRVLRSEAGWSKIKRLDGKTGWVPSGSFEKI